MAKTNFLSYENNYVKIKYPAYLKVTEILEYGTVTFTAEDMVDGLGTGITLNMGDLMLKQPVQSLEDYVKMKQARFQILFKDFKLIESGEIKLSGQKGRKLVFTGTANVMQKATNQAKPIAVQQMMVSVLFNGVPFSLTLGTRPENYSKYISDYEEMLKSFEVKKTQ
jgi:hypothetical protein